MKKYVAFILALVLCLPLCACAAVEDNEPTETISMEELLSDMKNEAKAQLDVGKSVAIYGQIRKVYSDYCVVELIVPNDGYTATFNVAMELELLAKLESQQFIAVQGIVSESNSSGYTITATKMLDWESMDSYIKEKANSNAYSIDKVYDSLNISLVYNYIQTRGDIFMLKDDATLKEYLIGTWVVSGYGETCEFREDGKYLWKYIGTTSSGKQVDKEQESSWSVKDGDLQAFRAYGNTNVYILCDDVFIQMGTVNVRKNSNENGDTIDTTTNALTFRTITLDDEATANNILELWRAGEATDASMKEIMDEYGADQGGGLLYELDNPENYIQEIASWCLDTSRSAGDATVIKTEYGYAVVYIVSLGNS